MKRDKLQNKEVSSKGDRKNKRRQCLSLKPSKLLQGETKSILNLLDYGIGYLATLSEITQGVEYYKAMYNLILARDKYKTLINAVISMSLRRVKGGLIW